MGKDKIMEWVERSIIVGLALCFTVKVLESEGFCVRKFAFLPSLYTEQQLIDKAILYKMERMAGTLILRDGRPPVKLKRYASLEEFNQFNPNCCELTETGPENYTNSSFVGYVKVTYDTLYEADLRKDSTMDAYIAYDSCGNLYTGYINSF